MTIIIGLALPSEGTGAALGGVQLRGFAVTLMVFRESLDNGHGRPQGELFLKLV